MKSKNDIIYYKIHSVYSLFYVSSWFIILSICIKSEEYKMASIKFLFSDIKNSDCFHVVQNCLKTQKKWDFQICKGCFKRF